MKSMKKWIEKNKNRVLSALLNPRIKNTTALQKRNFVFIRQVPYSRVQVFEFIKLISGKATKPLVYAG